MNDLFQLILQDGYKGAAILLMCVISYKLYKMKSASEVESKCCKGFSFSATTENEGGHLHANISDETTQENNV